MQTRILFAAKTYFPQANLQPESTPNEYLKVIKPYDMAALMGTIYTYSKCAKRCEEQEFKFISKLIQEAADLGGYVGNAIPRIGFANGLLAGAFSIMSLCTFMLQDIKAYKEIRRKSKAKGMRYHLATELEAFSCTHAHVCSWVIPPLGFGVQVARALTEGFLAELGTPPPPDQESYKFYITMIWIEALLKTGNPPEITHKGGYYPLKDDMTTLLQEVGLFTKNGSKHSWLEKAKEDLTAGTTEEVVEEEIPEEIRKELSE